MKTKIESPNLIEKDHEFFWGWGTRQLAEIPITPVGQCGACGKNFDSIELVFYAQLDSSIICRKCTKSHGTVEPRLFIGKEVI